MSPGPRIPEEAGVCVDLVRALGGTVPMLGVCLGHQAIGVAYGATVVRAPAVVHGKVGAVHHSGAGVLRGLDDPVHGDPIPLAGRRRSGTAGRPRGRPRGATTA